ncbi:head GIN domain-containing protein [Devosia sp. CAU 1758]
MRRARPFIAAGIAGLALSTPALAQSRDFDLDGFDKIDIATGLDARVTLADTFSVHAASRSDDALDNLQLSVEGGVLVARIESSFLDFIFSGGLVGMLFSSGNAVTLDITLPALTAATASSGADISLKAIAGDTLKLDASSGADIVLEDAKLRQFDASASSGSDIDVSGTAETVNLDASSGSGIDAENLRAEMGNLQASSGANISAHLAEQVRAQASSSADIDVSGNPRQRDVDASSGGDISFDD